MKKCLKCKIVGVCRDWSIQILKNTSEDVIFNLFAMLWHYSGQITDQFSHHQDD